VIKGQTAHYILMPFNHIHAVKHLKKAIRKAWLQEICMSQFQLLLDETVAITCLDSSDGIKST